MINSKYEMENSKMNLEEEEEIESEGEAAPQD